MAYALPVLSLPDNFPVLPADFHFFLHNDPGHIPAVLTVSHASTEYIPALLSAAVPSEAANSSPRTSRMHMHGSIPRFDNELLLYVAPAPSRDTSPVPGTPRSAPSPDTADPGTSPDTVLLDCTHIFFPYTPQKSPFSD